MVAPNTFTVFLLEDNLLYAALLKQHLLSKGCAVTCFQTGSEMLLQVHNKPDLILLDFHLQDGETGLDVLKSIKAFDPDLPVVLLSAQDTIHIAVSALKYGAFDYLEKNELVYQKLDVLVEKIIRLPELLQTDIDGAFGIRHLAGKIFKLFARVTPIVVLVIALQLSACTANRILINDRNVSIPKKAQQDNTNFDSTSASIRLAKPLPGTIKDTAAVPSIAKYQHHIKPDDKLAISVWNHDEISVGSLFGIYNSNEVYGKWVLVDKDSNVVVPSLGPVKLGGLTCNEASEVLKKLLSHDIKNPMVVVKVLNMQVTVLGEVKTPGIYTLEKENNSLLEMLGRAGGTTYYANNRKISILRGNPNKPNVHLVDLKKISGLQTATLLLEPDDVVYIPPRGRQKMDKDVGTYVSVGSILTTAVILLTKL